MASTAPTVAPGRYHVRRRYSGIGERTRDNRCREIGYLAVELGDIAHVVSGAVGIGHPGNEHDWYVWCRGDLQQEGWLPYMCIGTSAVATQQPLIVSMADDDEVAEVAEDAVGEADVEV